MGITRPKGEQLEFVSANTGTHVLDTYMEAAEIGGRELSELLGDIFDSSSGNFDATIFSFRVLTTDNNKLQVRVQSGNDYVDTGVEIFNGRGTYATSTAYKVLDIVTKDQDTFVCTVAHTSSASDPDITKFQKVINGSLVNDFANKTDGAVSGSDYSAKAWAVGGTGVTDTANAGAAKEWATKTSGTVDGTNYSAKYWATDTNVTTVSSNISDITTVATDIADVTTVADNIADVTTVADNDADITAVADNEADITTVAGISSNVTTVAGISSSVSSVAADATDIGTVATDLTGSDNIGTVAGSIDNVNTVAGIDSNITSVAGNSTNINTVAGSIDNVNTVGGSIANVNTVAGSDTNISTVATNISDVNTVATNVADVNNFADRYVISATAPSSPSEGDLWFDTTNDEMKVYDGTSFVASAAFASATTDDLSDVAATQATDDQVLVYDSTSSTYVPTDYSLQAITDAGATTTNTITVATPTADGHAATKAYVDAEVAAVVDSAPEALDTLNELSAALNDDANFATTVNNSIATKLPLAGGTLTGNVDFDNNKATDVTLENFQEVMSSNTNVSGAVTIPDATNNVSYTLTGDTTVTLPDTDELPTGTARSITIFVKQDATGSRTFTFAAPSGYSIKYNNSSTQPAVNATANKETIYTALLVKDSTTIYVSLSFYEA